MPRRRFNDADIELLHKRMALNIYWFRADLMYRQMRRLIDRYDGDFIRLNAAGKSLELHTYAAFWLSGLFVMFEGFQKLKLRDVRIARLSNTHINTLKQFRHDTFHFTAEGLETGAKMAEAFGWAEELHGAFRAHVVRYTKKVRANAGYRSTKVLGATIEKPVRRLSKTPRTRLAVAK